MAAKTLDLPPPSTVPLVGREKEREILAKALADAKVAGGQTWLVEGAAGIGKTRLVRWLEEEAVKKGFRVLWGYCLKESNLPFFPFQQIFRSSNPDTAVPATSPNGGDDSLPLLTIFESERPLRLLDKVAALSSSHSCLVVSRERPDHLRKQFRFLAPDARVLQLTKGGEGEDCLPPGQVDAIGERLSQHLSSGKGAVVAVTNLDYLVSQNGFQPVLRLVQFLREEAERADAHVLFSVNPATLEKREMALLEGEGDVVRDATPTPAAAAPSGPEPPAITMLRYLETLEREAPHQPRLLVIDDVQWADPDSLRTLQFLARNIRSLPVLLVGTMRVKEWRTIEDKTDQVLDEILGKIDEEGSLFRLPLGGLAEQESQDLVERTIGLPLLKSEGDSENALLSIFKRAEGNPYFVQETMRQLAQEGLLRKEGNHAVLAYHSIEDGTPAGEAPPIPPTLRRLVARRLSMLTEEEMDLLRWASVVGSEFDLPPLVVALERPGADVLALLRRLERDLHILDAQPGGERWSFGHPLVWEVTLSETDAEERRRKALKLADWWTEHRGGDVGTVARLYNDAKEPGRGLPWVRKAVDMAISQHAPETVVRYHRWLQDLLQLAGTSPEGRLQEGMAVCERHLVEMGASPSLAHMLEFLLDLPARPAERLPARILLAYSMAGQNTREARVQIDSIRVERSRDNIHLPPKWEALLELANVNVLIRLAKFKSVIDELDRMAPLLEELKEPWLKGRAAYARGHCSGCLGNVAETKKSLMELRKLIPESGSPGLELFCSALEATVAETEGDFRQAEAGQTRANAIARRQGDMRSTALSLTNMTISAGCRGSYDTAREYAQECHKFCSRFGFKDMEDFLVVGECAVLWGEQRWPELVQKLKEAFSKSVGNETGRALAHTFLAEGHIELGDLPAARASLNESQQRKEEMNPGEVADLLRVRARLEEREGDPASARKTLAEALRILEERPHMYWGAWVNRELARWEFQHGDPALGHSFRAQAESLFERGGALPAAWKKWLQDIHPKGIGN